MYEILADMVARGAPDPEVIWIKVSDEDADTTGKREEHERYKALVVRLSELRSAWEDREIQDEHSVCLGDRIWVKVRSLRPENARAAAARLQASAAQRQAAEAEAERERLARELARIQAEKEAAEKARGLELWVGGRRIEGDAVSDPVRFRREPAGGAPGRYQFRRDDLVLTVKEGESADDYRIESVVLEIFDANQALVDDGRYEIPEAGPGPAYKPGRPGRVDHAGPSGPVGSALPFPGPARENGRAVRAVVGFIPSTVSGPGLAGAQRLGVYSGADGVGRGDFSFVQVVVAEERPGRAAGRRPGPWGHGPGRGIRSLCPSPRSGRQSR